MAKKPPGTAFPFYHQAADVLPTIYCFIFDVDWLGKIIIMGITWGKIQFVSCAFLLFDQIHHNYIIS